MAVESRGLPPRKEGTLRPRPGFSRERSAPLKDPGLRPPEKELLLTGEGADPDVCEGSPAPFSRCKYRAPAAEDLRRVLDAARRGGDLLFLCSLAWELGIEFVNQRSYARAADCFQCMLRASRDLDDQFLVELAGIAGRLCAAISDEQPPGKDLLLAYGRLRQGLFEMTHEDLGLARDALAARAEARSSAVLEPSSTSPMDLSTSRPVADEVFPRTDACAEDRSGPRVDRAEAPTGASDSDDLHLRVLLLGRFEVLHRGERVSLGQNSRASALFKCLLTHTSQPVSQDYLRDWLWPNSDPRKARWSLNSAIYALRRALSSELPSSISDYVLLDHGHYRLSSRIHVSSDVEEFDARYERGRLLEKGQRGSEAAEEYEKALVLYRGDYRAEDLYEDWTTIERERLINAYMDMMYRLAAYYSKGGQLWKSIQSQS